MIFVLMTLGCVNDSPSKEISGEEEASFLNNEACTEERLTEHGGVSRRYFVHVPQNIPVGSPLVVVMHGYTGSAEGIMEYSAMNELADRNGFVVLYPQGTRDQYGYSFFNVGYDFHVNSGIDDLGFVLHAVEEIQ